MIIGNAYSPVYNSSCFLGMPRPSCDSPPSAVRAAGAQGRRRPSAGPQQCSPRGHPSPSAGLCLSSLLGRIRTSAESRAGRRLFSSVKGKKKNKKQKAKKNPKNQKGTSGLGSRGCAAGLLLLPNRRAAICADRSSLTSGAPFSRKHSLTPACAHIGRGSPARRGHGGVAEGRRRAEKAGSGEVSGGGGGSDTYLPGAAPLGRGRRFSAARAS